jgi:hypothetical protein
MATPGDKLSPLFKSLQPNKSQFEVSNTAAVQEAEQRWPLFKAVAPVKLSVPPALSEDDRQHWRSKENVEIQVTKPALSVPGLSDKLAQSLSKMGGEKKSPRRAPKVAKIDKDVEPRDSFPKVPTNLPMSNQVIEKAPVTKLAPVSSPETEVAPIANRTPILKAAAALKPHDTVVQNHSAAMEDQARAMNNRKVVAKNSEIVNKPVTIKSNLETGDTSIRTRESLKSLFSRLEKPEPPKIQSSLKTKTSFLGRLGKR